jgi:hypothetical protein
MKLDTFTFTKKQPTGMIGKFVLFMLFGLFITSVFSSSYYYTSDEYDRAFKVFYTTSDKLWIIGLYSLILSYLFVELERVVFIKRCVQLLVENSSKNKKNVIITPFIANHFVKKLFYTQLWLLSIITFPIVFNLFGISFWASLLFCSLMIVTERLFISKIIDFFGINEKYSYGKKFSINQSKLQYNLRHVDI